MKNLSSSLFKKFESNKIDNLAKVVGGAWQNTTWTQGYNSGADEMSFETCNGYTASGTNPDGSGWSSPCDFCKTSLFPISSQIPEWIP